MSKLESKIGQICNFPSGRAATAIALIAAMATGLAACSATPDEVKPAAIYGADGAAPTPEGTKGFPQLADTPDQRPKSTSPADQKAIQDELIKDRETAKDKDSALRAGQAGSMAAKPSPQRLAEIDKAAAAAATTETAAVTPPAKAVASAPEKPVPAVAAVAPEPTTPAVEPAPAPAKVAAAEPAPAPKQELATPYVAPNLPPEPAAPVAATAGTAALLSKIEEPASATEMQMASAETTGDPVMSPAAAPAIINGVIPMPPRGGHKTLAAVMTRPESVGDEGTEKAEPEEKAADVIDPNAEAPVSAAPTTRVEVSKPTQAPTAP